MVGQGLHRVDQRQQGRPPVSGSSAAETAWRTGILRPASDRRDAPANRARQVVRRTRFLLPLLLVFRETAPRTAVEPVHRQPGYRFSILSLLGQRKLDPALERPGSGHSVGADL